MLSENTVLMCAVWRQTFEGVSAGHSQLPVHWCNMKPFPAVKLISRALVGKGNGSSFKFSVNYPFYIKQHQSHRHTTTKDVQNFWILSFLAIQNYHLFVVWP